MTGRVEERHGRILRLVRERGSMRVVELAEELGTSPETMRRDVVALADIGRLRRIHGKVAWPSAELSARDARLARRDTLGQGQVIGLILPAAGYVHQDVVRGARVAAHTAGARLLVGISEDDRGADESRQRRALAEAGADGFLLTPTWDVDGPSPEDLAGLTEIEAPVVVLEREIPPGTPAACLDRVCSDHANGAARAVQHLAALGHTRIALLARRTHGEPQIRAGYRAAIDALGLPRDEVGVTAHTADGEVPRDTTPFEDRLDALAAMALDGRVRSALVHTDNDAINLHYRLIAAGVRVPEDFALISYGDESVAMAEVPLTAVAPPKHALGQAAVGLLLRRLANPDVERQHISFVPELNVRGSCGALAGEPRVPAPRRAHDDSIRR